MSGLELTGNSGLQLVASTNRTVDVATADKRQDVSVSGKALPQPVTSAATRSEVEKAVRDISEYMQSVSRDLQFQMDEVMSSTIITVRDPETSEVVRQIPGEQVVAIAHYIAEFAPDPLRAMLVDSKA